MISRLQRSVESFIFVVPHCAQAVDDDEDDDDEGDADADADDDGSDDDVDGPAHELVVLACLPS